MEPILEQKTSNPSFPRMISPSETLSSLIASSKVKTYNKAPNSVHERLYSDSQIRKKSKIIQNKEHSRLKPKVNQTKGIEDRLFVKARALEAKRDRIREK